MTNVHEMTQLQTTVLGSTTVRLHTHTGQTNQRSGTRRVPAYRTVQTDEVRVEQMAVGIRITPVHARTLVRIHMLTLTRVANVTRARVPVVTRLGRTLANARDTHVVQSTRVTVVTNTLQLSHRATEQRMAGPTLALVSQMTTVQRGTVLTHPERTHVVQRTHVVVRALSGGVRIYVHTFPARTHPQLARAVQTLHRTATALPELTTVVERTLVLVVARVVVRLHVHHTLARLTHTTVTAH